MRFFPIFLDLDRQPVLVVGGGEQAAQKLRLLARTGASVRVLAEAPCPEVEALAAAGGWPVARRAPTAGDFAGARLAYVAVGDDAVAAAAAAAMARAAGVPVNTVDRQELCDFLTPAIVDRDPVVVAIGTEGTAPVLARQIKARLEAALPARLGALARWAAAWRGRAAATVARGGARRRFWEGFFDGPVARAFMTGRRAEAAGLLRLALADGGGAPGPGRVTLVGAGPGDPDLLTFKALRAMQEADLVVADRLVPEAILDRARRDAERVLVGKTPGRPSPGQDGINALLVREARAGRHVVRLKGGDPFVFGRGGEELAHLRAAGVPVEVVPGITAAAGCAAAVGLPLTERGERRSLTLLTGHASDGPAEHDWAALARPGQLLAVYMGVGAAAHVRDRLRAAGMPAGTPVTVVENGTLPNQRLAVGDLGGLADLVVGAGIGGPAVIFVGAHPVPAAGAGAGAGAGRARVGALGLAA